MTSWYLRTRPSRLTGCRARRSAHHQRGIWLSALESGVVCPGGEPATARDLTAVAVGRVAVPESLRSCDRCAVADDDGRQARGTLISGIARVAHDRRQHQTDDASRTTRSVSRRWCDRPRAAGRSTRGRPGTINLRVDRCQPRCMLWRTLVTHALRRRPNYSPRSTGHPTSTRAG